MKAKNKKNKTRQDTHLPFTKKNYQLFAAGLLVLLIAYIFLSIGPWDSFWSRTLAPVILIVGYLVIIPWAILANKKENKSAS
ncbi:MAG TPA: hypothetical protein ENH09_04245 [Bacteroidetes bacterium]|nr:hypothetical protein [Bacteroidota bacterium]